MNSIPVEKITPDLASAWLNDNKSNRKLRDGVVEKYARDMQEGRWTNCPMPICFYEDGDVADGQHRLWAVIESKTSQFFPVVRGLSRADGLNIDTGLNRSLVDNANISGADKDLTNELISVCRAIECGARGGGREYLSNAQKLGYVDKHREAARWVISCGPRGKGIRTSMLLAALGRAWYIETDHDRLRRFCDVFSSGFQDGTDESAAIALRNYITSKGSTTAGSPALWRDTFLKAQNCIKYFMQRVSLTVVKRVSDEAYPLRKPSKR